MNLHPLLCSHTDPTLFHLRVTLPWKTLPCIFCGSARSDPLPAELHPPLSVHRSSKGRCLLLSEATHEININLTSDRML